MKAPVKSAILASLMALLLCPPMAFAQLRTTF